MAYEFVCLHCPNKTMKDIDGVRRHIDPLIHRYLVDAAAMSSNDIALRLFAYNFDVFSQYTNLRHISHHDDISDAVTIYAVPTSLALYHYPI